MLKAKEEGEGDAPSEDDRSGDSIDDGAEAVRLVEEGWKLGLDEFVIIIRREMHCACIMATSCADIIDDGEGQGHEFDDAFCNGSDECERRHL